MEANIAAWMIAGGRTDLAPREARNLRNLWILRAARELCRPANPLVHRFRAVAPSLMPARRASAPECCTA